MVGFGIGILVAIVGGYVWHIFASMLEDWALKRISTQLAARKEADRAKEIRWKGIFHTSIGPDR